MIACFVESIPKLYAECVAGRTLKSQLKNSRANIFIVGDYSFCLPVYDYGVSLRGGAIPFGDKLNGGDFSVTPVNVKIAALAKECPAKARVSLAPPLLVIKSTLGVRGHAQTTDRGEHDQSRDC